MKIALITDGIWPYVLGGMQKHSYYLCKYLAQNKIHVDLYHFNQSTYKIEELAFFTEEEKVYIQSFVIDFPKSFHFPGHYLYNSYRYSKLIFESLKDKLNLYDFFYTKGFAGWYLIDQKYKKLINCAPIGVKFHGYEMFQITPSLKVAIQSLLFLRYPVKTISRRADVVFSYGGKITSIIESLGVAPKKIIEMPSGVENSFKEKNIQPTGKIIKIVYLGRYERRKGIEELNDSINTYLKQSKNNKLEFHFIGPIPEDKQLKLKDVIYHGEIRDKLALKKELRACDILICPSWSEGFPNVILEGMALGLAIIATEVGATIKMVDSFNGWLIDLPKHHLLLELFNRINQVDIKSIDDKKELSIVKIEEDFTWEHLIPKLIEKIKTIK